VSRPHFDGPTFLRALRKNGSLHEVSLDPESKRDPPFFSAPDLLKIQSICNRNRCTRGMLQKPAWDSDSTMSNNTYAPIQLVPSLFRAVGQAPRTAVSYILAGLLVRDNDDRGLIDCGTSGVPEQN
jgi:hypothetical protein